MILGVAWLQRFGKVTFDWEEMTLSFCWKGERVVLQGQKKKSHYKHPEKPVASLQSLMKENVEEKCPREEKRLSDEQEREIQQVLNNFSTVFREPQGLPPSRSVAHAIELHKEAGPVSVRPYRYPYHHKEEIEKQVSEMLQQGLIRHNSSAFSSPVILVRKKDNSWRMCVDYRQLNKVTIPDKYPIPVVEELLDELHGAAYFSKLDLKSGYHQIRMRKEDIHKTAFRTHEGHYEYLVMPFGLTNAPATFQSTMNQVFKPYLRKFVLVFFDDILVYSEGWREHLEHLTTVMEVLKDQRFVANRKKCVFGSHEVEYLGHLISAQGVAVDPEKIRSVIEWPLPRNVRGVRGFLGLTGYYRKFIAGYGKIAKPLTELTKKEGFNWNPTALEAFDELKRVMTQAPVLTLPNFSQPFEIECDASGKGIGAVLMQNRHPIAYFSKALSPNNLSKSAYEKELMALVLAVQHWRPYLLGRSFKVYSDQKSLRHILQQRITTADQQNWIAKLLGYHFEVIYKPGPENKAADSLSRVFEEGELREITSFPIWMHQQQLQQEKESDPLLKKIVKDLQQDANARPGFSVHQGVLLYHGRLVLSANSILIPNVLAEFHSSPAGGHSGFLRTYRRIAGNLYWVGMKKMVQDFVKKCDICQRQKYIATSPAGLLQPLPIPDRIWEDISLDFITGLPKSKGFEAIFVVVDRLSKYSHFLPLKHPYTARTVVEVFAKEIVRLHGIPQSIVSDRDPLFMSLFWKELFRLQGTTLKMSSSYHPETDGQTEVVNRCLEAYLRCFVSEQPKTWSYWVPWAELWYNTTFHGSTGKTPFEVVYGRTPPPLVRFTQGETRVEAVATELVDRDEALRQLKYHLLRAQQQMKKFADKKRKFLEFEKGDWVFIKLRPHRQQTVARRINQKLAPRYYGPFPIVARIGAVSYKVKLPEATRVHPVFHISQLKKAIGEYVVESVLPAELEIDQEDIEEPETVLASREVLKAGQMIRQWLVKWKGRAIDDTTWEDEMLLQSQFPSLRLEDKAVSAAEGSDRASNLGGPTIDQEETNVTARPKVWQVYSRRKKVGQGEREKGS
ncbi:putative nucleotidyltransferase, Ribonuclease H [Lupinus albus]|uniref:Putative nucleotidyltransferase, Ribonuclease H n=1 Tax=Lupinus albus TaxID=3870 RepID=A0A6A4PN65_LUPAL|nr:putative nucleotidyltransferase, Ribonuclease H [Lupinus albus]